MGTVLQDIVEKKHYRFVDEEMTWQEAVRQSCLSLVDDGSVDADYYKEIVACLAPKIEGALVVEIVRGP